MKKYTRLPEEIYGVGQPSLGVFCFQMTIVAVIIIGSIIYYRLN
jgi:hypothetical protein